MNTEFSFERSPDAWLRRAIELALQVHPASVIGGQPWETTGPADVATPDEPDVPTPRHAQSPSVSGALPGVGGRGGFRDRRSGSTNSSRFSCLAVVEPGVKHCEGFRRRKSGYAVLWLWPGTSATVRAPSAFTYAAEAVGICGDVFLAAFRSRGRAFSSGFLAGPDPWMRHPQWLERVRADLLAVLGDLNRQEVHRGEVSGKGSEDHRREVMLEEVRDLLDQHLHQGIGVGELARPVHLTPNYLNRIFAQWSGESVYSLPHAAADGEEAV